MELHKKVSRILRFVFFALTVLAVAAVVTRSEGDDRWTTARTLFLTLFPVLALGAGLIRSSFDAFVRKSRNIVASVTYAISIGFLSSAALAGVITLAKSTF